jgi:hypothetical protein
MEKRDYSKFRDLLIDRDLPISFVNSPTDSLPYEEYFKKLNIRTLEDLFNAYDNGVFNDRRKKHNIEVKGQTELLMSYYIGTPLIGDVILDKTIHIDTKLLNNMYNSREDDIWTKLARIGFSGQEIYFIYSYIHSNREFLVTENGTQKVFEIIKRFANDKPFQAKIISEESKRFADFDVKSMQNFVFKTKFLEQYMENKKLQATGFPFKNVSKEGLADRTTIQALESQMEFLLNEKETIDKQIEVVQNQLNNIKKAGGMRL